MELICAALLAKSEALIKIADFQGAKQVLRKAYKFKTPNRSESKIIEKNLRVGMLSAFSCGWVCVNFCCSGCNV